MQAQSATANRAIAWALAHPAEMEWIGSNMDRNDFALSMAQSIDKWGSLTDGQLGAVRNNLAPRAAAVEISVAEIEAKFAIARSNQVKQPRMRLDTFVFKAVIKGQNAGGIYVTEGQGEEGSYLGKIKGGKFMPSRECTDDQKSRILAAASNPDEAAKAYGQRTGNCCICGRELTAEESIAAFIGPVCAERWGM